MFRAPLAQSQIPQKAPVIGTQKTENRYNKRLQK